MKKPIVDMSGEMILQPYYNGLKLIRPKKALGVNSLNTLADVFKLPLCFYFLDKNSAIQNMNDKSIITCGYPPINKCLGKTRSLVATEETVDKIVREDRMVIKHNQIFIFEEEFVRLDEVNFPSLAFKFPWYDDENKMIGIFGCSLNQENLNVNLLAQSLMLLLNLKLLIPAGCLNNPFEILPGKKIKDVYLSKREMQCLQLFKQGKTIKMTAKILGLSPRTVEHYLENIKTKLNISYKSELIGLF